MGDLTWDILGLGCAAVDDLVYVVSYPLPDAKTPILRRERHCGGLTAAAIKATQRGGQVGIPVCSAVEAFLKEQLP